MTPPSRVRTRPRDTGRFCRTPIETGKPTIIKEVRSSLSSEPQAQREDRDRRRNRDHRGQDRSQPGPDRHRRARGPRSRSSRRKSAPGGKELKSEAVAAGADLRCHRVGRRFFTNCDQVIQGGRVMLVLSRKLNERIVIDGGIVVTVVKIDRNHVRIGIEAPAHVPVFREEIAPMHLSRNADEVANLRAKREEGWKRLDKIRSGRPEFNIRRTASLTVSGRGPSPSRSGIRNERDWQSPTSTVEGFSLPGSALRTRRRALTLASSASCHRRPGDGRADDRPPRRPLGETGVDVRSSTRDPGRAPNSLDRTPHMGYAGGVRYIDTADCYGSEPGIAKWFEIDATPGRRKEDLHSLPRTTRGHPAGLIAMLEPPKARAAQDRLRRPVLHSRDRR